MVNDDFIPNSIMNAHSMGVSVRKLDGVTSEPISGLVMGFIPTDDATVTIESSVKYSEDERATDVTGIFSYPVGIAMIDPIVSTTGIVYAVLG